MRDRFDEIIDRFILPMDRLERVIDSSYFLRGNLSFVFAQGYYHPHGTLYGKLINYPDEGGILDIFGRRYGTTNKRLVDGELELIPIDEQLDIHFRVEPGLEKSDSLPPFARYHTRFRTDDCVGYFDHKHSLEVAQEIYPWMPETITQISDFLEIPVGNLGLTGSHAYGKADPEHDDVDLAIYGSLEDHGSIIRKLDEWLKVDENRVFEFGRYWPMRFFLEGTLVCPFFIYDRREEIPLEDFEMELVKDGVSFSGHVCDDTHSIYLPVMVQLEDLKLDGEDADNMPLILYDSATRGEYRLGDTLAGDGKIVNVRTKEKEFAALLVTIGTAIKKT